MVPRSPPPPLVPPGFGGLNLILAPMTSDSNNNEKLEPATSFQAPATPFPFAHQNNDNGRKANERTYRRLDANNRRTPLTFAPQIQSHCKCLNGLPSFAFHAKRDNSILPLSYERHQSSHLNLSATTVTIAGQVGRHLHWARPMGPLPCAVGQLAF